MKKYEKFLDERGQATTKDKAVVRIVSVYDDDGKFIEERIGGLVDTSGESAVD